MQRDGHLALRGMFAFGCFAMADPTEISQTLVNTAIGLINLVAGAFISAIASRKAQQQELRAAAVENDRQRKHQEQMATIEAYVRWFRAYEVYKRRMGTLLARTPTQFAKEEHQEDYGRVLAEAGDATIDFDVAKSELLLRESDAQNRKLIEEIHDALAPHHATKDMKFEGPNEEQQAVESFRTSVKYMGQQGVAFSRMKELVNRVSKTRIDPMEALSKEAL